MLLPTTEVPEVSVKFNDAVLLARLSVLPAAPSEPPVPILSVPPAFTVVAPAKAVLAPVKVNAPTPACIKLPAPVKMAELV